MAHVSGLFLVDCPASALNNAGQFMEMEKQNKYENWTAIKKIRTREGVFPYVSGQAFRSWLRESLKSVEGWTASPTFREEKIAYTDANPILYAEDDIFGYMRAPGGGKEAVKDLKQKWAQKSLSDQELRKDKFAALTRISPFKVSTLISIAALNSSAIGYDYGNMARTEDQTYPNPVPYEHEFYRTTLVGLFSVDLRMLGRFYHVERTGYKHLDSVRKELAEKKQLKAYDSARAYELPLDLRRERLKQLLMGLARVSGGAKLALHYTDVSPRLMMLGVAKGGNHLFGTAVSADKGGLPRINIEALKEVARVYKDDLLSGFYVGLTQGYLDEQRETLRAALDELSVNGRQFTLSHPVEAVNAVIGDIDRNKAEWLA